MHMRILNLAAFPHLDVSICPCQPSWTISPLISPSSSNFPMGGVPPVCPPHPISTIPTLCIHVHPLWPTWPPPRLHAHLCTPLHTLHTIFPGFFIHPLHFLCPGTFPFLSHAPWLGKCFFLGKTRTCCP